MNFRIFESVDELVRAAADAVANSIESRERSVVALSGGSTPTPIYEILGKRYRAKLEEKEVVWVTGDERDVPHGDASSNRSMIERTLFADGIPAGHSFLHFDTSIEDREQVAFRFEQRWRELGIDHLNLAILGMGDDGHTASLFPETVALDVTDRVAVANRVSHLDSWRYTLTFPVLQNSDEIIVLAAGEKKRAIIERLESGEEFPISRALLGEGSRWWLVDRAARPFTSIDRGPHASDARSQKKQEGG